MRRLGILVAAAVLASCRGPLAVGAALTSPERDPPWVTDPALPERTSAAAGAMARAWGSDPSVLDGWKITFVDRYVAKHGRAIVVGRAIRTPVVGGGKIEIWTGTSPICVEATNLGHEVGHVVIHDHDHRDARWTDRAFWDRMAEALRAIVPPGDERCLECLASGKGIWH